MSRKIIGVTVGTQLPKPNFKQHDPTKGDYIKNKPDFDGLKAQVDDISELADQIAASLPNKADLIDGKIPAEQLPDGYAGGSGEGGVTSWNDLEDKPFGIISPDKTITWDGNTDGLPMVNIPIDVLPFDFNYYKLSDNTYEKENLLGNEAFSNDAGELVAHIMDLAVEFGNGSFYVTNSNNGVPFLFVCKQAGDIFDGDLFESPVTVTFSEAGLWVFELGIEGVPYSYLAACEMPAVIKQIDEQYIPDAFIKTDVMGITNGVATLDDTGKVPASQLPQSVAGITSWNDLKDKPFYDTRTAMKIEIPNDISDIPTLLSRPSEELDGMSITFVKMSDDYIPPEDMLGCIIDYNKGSGGTCNFVIEDRFIFTDDSGFYVAYVDDEGDMMFPTCLSVHASGTLNMFEGMVVFDVEPGLYFLYDEMLGETVNYFEKSGGELKTLDIKYLPSNMALGYEAKLFDDIVWDGNIDGLLSTSLDIPEYGMTYTWYKLSDKFIPLDDMIGGTYVTQGAISTDENGSTYTIEEPMLMHENGSVLLDISIASINTPNTTFDLDGMEIFFPTEGIWFMRIDMDGAIGWAESLKASNTLVQFDEKFIPDTIARKSDLEGFAVDVDLSNYYTKSDIDGMIGDCSAVLDEISILMGE